MIPHLVLELPAVQFFLPGLAHASHFSILCRRCHLPYFHIYVHLGGRRGGVIPRWSLSPGASQFPPHIYCTNRG